MLFRKSKPKIFCIGQNKTGTTSLKRFFKDHGFTVGDQAKGEMLLDHYIAREWKPILAYCNTAQVFQDIPFSNSYLYILLDYHFPNAKFILSERVSPEEWYQSISKFHSKLFGDNGSLPSKENLQNATYRYKGFLWKSFSEKYGDVEEDLYNKERLIKIYLNRNNQIKHYFKNKSNFIKINVSDNESLKDLSEFLNISPKYKEFPWENKTLK